MKSYVTFKSTQPSMLTVRAALLATVMCISLAAPSVGYCGASGAPSETMAPKAGSDNPTVIRPNTSFRGKTYSQWSASFWQWALALPLNGHPFNECMKDFSAGQSGNVWYWSSPDGPVTCNETIPAGTAIFLTIRDVETSSLEDPPFHGVTAVEQAANSKWFADHIVKVFCTIDGEPVENIMPTYRFSSGQYVFTAPSPWVFGTTGGTGSSVADGYYLMLRPLSKGKHTIHYGGTFHFNAGELGPDPVDLPKDVTLQLTVSPSRREGQTTD